MVMDTLTTRAETGISPAAMGARAEEVAKLLGDAGFSDIRVDFDLGAIHRAQRRNFPLLKGLERATQHRYAISAVKPSS